MRTLQTMTAILMGLLLSSMTAMGTTANDEQIAQSVKVNWKQIYYQKSITLRHESQGLQKPAPDVSEKLSLSCEIEIQNTNLILGTASQGIIKRSFLDSQGRPIEGSIRSGELPVMVGGSGGVGGSDFGDIKTIRYIIAVHPTEHKVPFELKDIPLPKP